MVGGTSGVAEDQHEGTKREPSGCAWKTAGVHAASASESRQERCVLSCRAREQIILDWAIRYNGCHHAWPDTCDTVSYSHVSIQGMSDPVPICRGTQRDGVR